jgi:hypothetical protein
MNNTYEVLVIKSEEKRPLGRPRRRWDDNIRMDLMEIGVSRCGLDRIWLRIATSGGLLWTR